MPRIIGVGWESKSDDWPEQEYGKLGGHAKFWGVEVTDNEETLLTFTGLVMICVGWVFLIFKKRKMTLEKKVVIPQTQLCPRATLSIWIFMLNPVGGIRDLESHPIRHKMSMLIRNLITFVIK
jgi:hypothetical protein